MPINLKSDCIQYVKNESSFMGIKGYVKDYYYNIFGTSEQRKLAGGREPSDFDPSRLIIFSVEAKSLVYNAFIQYDYSSVHLRLFDDRPSLISSLYGSVSDSKVFIEPLKIFGRKEADDNFRVTRGAACASVIALEKLLLKEFSDDLTMSIVPEKVKVVDFYSGEKHSMESSLKRLYGWMKWEEKEKEGALEKKVDRVILWPENLMGA